MVKTTKVYIDGNLWSVTNPIVIPADGVTYKTVKMAYGGPTTSGNVVTLTSTAVAAISAVDGNVDPNSKFEFILGPDRRRGNFTVTVQCAGGYPDKILIVTFR